MAWMLCCLQLYPPPCIFVLAAIHCSAACQQLKRMRGHRGVQSLSRLYTPIFAWNTPHLLATVRHLPPPSPSEAVLASAHTAGHMQLWRWQYHLLLYYWTCSPKSGCGKD